MSFFARALWAAFVGVAVWSVSASAAITVTVVTQSGQNVQIGALAGHTTSPYNITFTVEPTSTPQTALSSPVVRVQANNGEVITSVVVKVDLPFSGSRVNLLVNGTGTGLSGMGSISRSGSSSGGELWVQSVVARDGVFGAISASRVLRVETTQPSSDITADIVETSGTISVGANTVTISANRHILGDITLRSPVEAIEAAAGNIGSSGSPVSIAVDNSVDLIEADAIWANIDLSVGTAHSLARLETRTGGFVGAGTGIDGLQAGDVPAGFGNGVFIAGDLDAEVSLSSLDAPFIIDGDLPSGREITIVQDFGLEDGGQITINNANDGSQWLGTVEVGNTSPIIITANPTYGATAAALGGGSIGEASFYLHENSCVPPEGGSFSIRTPDITSFLIPPPCDDTGIVVELRFYGPVREFLTPPSDEIVMVEKWNGSSWDDVTTSFQAADSGAALPASRIIEVMPVGGVSNWTVGLYRMTPFLDDTERFNIVSRDVVNEPEVQPFTYLVHVTDDCEEWLLARFDVDDDESLTYEGDVGAWLASPTELTNDGSINADDMDALLTAIERFNE